MSSSDSQRNMTADDGSTEIKGGEFVRYLKQFAEDYKKASTSTDDAPKSPLAAAIARIKSFTQEDAKGGDVKEIQGRIRNQVGRVFNDFRWDLDDDPRHEKTTEKYYASSLKNMNFWREQVEDWLAPARDLNNVVFPAKMGVIVVELEKGTRTLEVPMHMVDPKTRQEMLEVTELMIHEACRQILKNDEKQSIKEEVIALLQLPEWLKDHYDEVKLALVESYVAHILLSNLRISSDKERLSAQGASVVKENHEKAFMRLQKIIRGFLFSSYLEGDHLDYDYTDRFKELVLQKKPVKPRKAAEESVQKVFDEVMPVGKELFDSYFRDDYPLMHVPPKFNEASYAAVTKEDQAKLIGLIMRDHHRFLSEMGKVMASSMTSAIASHDDDMLSESKTREAATLLKREMQKLQMLDMQDISEQKKENVVDEKTLVKLRKVFAKFNHELKENKNPLCVKAINNLLNVAETPQEAIALLQVEKRVAPKGMVSAFSEAVSLIEKEFEKEAAEIKSDEKYRKHAEKLLKYANETEAAMFRAKPHEALAARAVAHQLVKFSLMQDPEKSAAAKKAIIEGIQRVCKRKGTALDSSLVKLLESAWYELEPSAAPQKTADSSILSMLRKKL